MQTKNAFGESNIVWVALKDGARTPVGEQVNMTSREPFSTAGNTQKKMIYVIALSRG